MTSDTVEVDRRYEIRHALGSDYEQLVRFIDHHWRKDHVFSTCKGLLDWQHLDRTTGNYNFVIGIERTTGDVQGVLGFIPLHQYDSDIELSRLVWMAIWKVQDAARGFKLGRHLMSYLEDLVRPEVMSTVAATSMTLPMYQARGFLSGTLRQFYIVNPAKTRYELVTVASHGMEPSSYGAPTTDTRLVPVGEAEIKSLSALFTAQEDLPRKTPQYVVNRYLRHPYFKYQAYAIRQGSDTEGVVVTRTCRHDAARALRIVEFIGPSTSLRGLEAEWIRLLREANAEFIDFYNAGIDDADLELSGFVRRVDGDGTVIPNYFEPFVKKNVDISYVIRLPAGKSYRIVKGDSDQDRPNIIGGAD